MNIRITKHAIERASERTLDMWRACQSDEAKAGLREWLTYLVRLAVAPMGTGTVTDRTKSRVRGVLLVLEPTADGGVSLVTVIDPANMKGRDRAKRAKGCNDKPTRMRPIERKSLRRTQMDDSTASFPLAGE